MDDPVPIEGILDGEPESLAAVCAGGGSAIVAYCSAVGADAYAADTVVAALATFRRGIFENADQEPAQVEALLLTSTAHAARRVACIDPSPAQQAAAQVALEGAVTAPLTPGLAPRIIRALVEAAPVTALGGDAAAVRRATEQHYIRMFDRYPAPTQPPPPAAPMAGPRAAAGAGAWIPPELAGLDAGVANVRAAATPAQWTPAPQGRPEAPKEPEAEAHGPPDPPPAPTVPAPGGLAIKRGGRWPFRRLPHKAPRGGAGGAHPGRHMLIGAIAGLAVGGGVVALAMPREEAPPDPILVRPLDTPFTLDGAVFNVVRTRQSLWALAIRRRQPRPGHSWITLAAQTRNISRTSFFPRALGFRLRTQAGIVIGPDTVTVPSDVTAARGRQAIGKRSSVHLGFQVPSAKQELTLEFDPGRTAPRIRVPLN